jgi:4-hydroxymandelate oxidase
VNAEAPLNLAEYEAAAAALVPKAAFDYVAGGAGDEVTLRENRAAFDRWRVLPRVLTGAGEPRLATSVLGTEASMPVLVAPSAFHKLVHPDGELASAGAARRAGIVYTMSTAASYPIEAVAPRAGAWWFQLYVYRDRAITRELVARAEAAGASALVVTVDTPIVGRREADERNRFSLPFGVTFANFDRPEQREMPANAEGSGLATYVQFESVLRWSDLDWLASITRLPVVPKGILAPDDARLALEHGARGIVVSNHGGRQLDSAVAALDALPAIAAAVDGRCELLLDGGVRRGVDVLKALALGARAVTIGRPIHWGLAVGGEDGLVRLLELLRAEIALALQLSGLDDVAQVTRSLVLPTGPLSA